VYGGTTSAHAFSTTITLLAKVSSTYIVYSAVALPAPVVVWPLRPSPYHSLRPIPLPIDGALQQQQWNPDRMCPRTLSYPCDCFVFLLVCSQAGSRSETERPGVEWVYWWYSMGTARLTIPTTGKGSSSKKQVISIGGSPSWALDRIMVWKLSWIRARTSESLSSTAKICGFVCLSKPMDLASLSAHSARPEPWCGVPRNTIPRVQWRTFLRCPSGRCCAVDKAYIS